MWARILDAAPQASCSQASPLQQDKPPGCISLIRLSNDLMHFLAATIKLNQVLMRLPFFRFALVLFWMHFPEETALLRSLGRPLCISQGGRDGMLGRRQQTL